MQKAKIITTEAPDLAQYVIKSIIDAIRAPNTEYLVEPGLEFVKEICGTQNGRDFVFKHIPRTKRGETDKVYAMYDNLEFTCDLNMILSEFYIIDSYVNKIYMYDANTDSCVLRPQMLSKLDVVLKWFQNRMH